MCKDWVLHSRYSSNPSCGRPCFISDSFSLQKSKKPRDVWFFLILIRRHAYWFQKGIGGKGERKMEGNINMREKHWSAFLYTAQSCNPDMYLDWESNPQPSSLTGSCSNWVTLARARFVISTENCGREMADWDYVPLIRISQWTINGRVKLLPIKKDEVPILWEDRIMWKKKEWVLGIQLLYHWALAIWLGIFVLQKGTFAFFSFSFLSFNSAIISWK